MTGLQRGLALVLLALAVAVGPALAQPPAPDVTAWTAELFSRYWVAPNQVYLTVDGREAKLDVYVSKAASATSPAPTVLMIHGGGWTGGDKSVVAMRLLPYLARGWSAVNIDYRLGPAPWAVEDCRCALRWVIRNAGKYHLDVKRLVVTGESAGSHLALMTGMLPPSAGFDTHCAGAESLQVAAVVSWYAVTDAADALSGENRQGYAGRWLGGRADSTELARRLSPLQYVRPGLPAILTIHGDADGIAPYPHAVRLHDALSAAGVPNRLLTIPGRGHGDFTRDELLRIDETIFAFLKERGIGAP